MSLFQELKRRNVIRVGIAYAVMAWVLLQAADFGLDLIDAPNWFIQALFLVAVIGLPVALVVAWVFELTPEGVKRESEIDRTASITPETGRKLDRTIIAFLVLALVLVLAERWMLAERTPTSPGNSGVAESVPAEEPAKSIIAILPFADLSQAQDQGWFADGLAEEILNALAKTPDILVAARSSSFQYRGTNTDIATIASELGVAHVLEGSVRSSGERIRVTAQLIRATDRFPIWSEDYDRDVADMISIQEDLASNIARALETTMDPEALANMAEVGTRSVEAYQAYMRGVALETSPSLGTNRSEEVLQSQREYERATELDPEFSDAYGRQASFWLGQLSPTYNFSGLVSQPPKELLARLNGAINQAIEHADDPIRQRGYQALRASINLQLREAARLFDEAVSAAPNNLDYLAGLGTAAMRLNQRETIDQVLNTAARLGMQRHNMAVYYLSHAYKFSDINSVADYAEQALQRFPESAQIMYQAHRTLLWAGRNEQAIGLASRLADKDITPELVQIRTACAQGRRTEAERVLEPFMADPSESPSAQWLALTMMGMEQEAVDTLRRIESSGVPFQLASLLEYHTFDPAPFPALAELLQRENVQRPPVAEYPFKCPPPKLPGIAVLPFINMSEETDNEYFSDGISEELLNVLVRVDGLRVPSRTSSFSFKGSNKRLDQIGRELNVDHVLEGSVRRAGDRIRVTAQLIEVVTDTHLWSETYTRQLDDIFAVQDEIAQAIVDALQVTLNTEQRQQLTRRPTQNIEAYNHYLQGRQLWHQRTETALRSSARALESAVALDPDYADAWAALADAYVLIPEYAQRENRTSEYRQLMEKGREATNRALAIEPDSARALTTRAYIRFAHDFDHAGARQDFQSALRLEPGYATAQQWYGEFLAVHRDYDQALQYLDAAIALDPLAAVIPHVRGWILSGAGRYEEAERSYEQALKIAPGFVPTLRNLTMNALLMGDLELYRERMAEYDLLIGGSGTDYELVIAAMTDPVARSRFLAKLRENIGILGFGQFTSTLGAMGEYDELMDHLEAALQAGDPYAVQANRWVILDPMRENPRFIEHLRRMNFEP